MRLLSRQSRFHLALQLAKQLPSKLVETGFRGVEVGEYWTTTTVKMINAVLAVICADAHI